MSGRTSFWFRPVHQCKTGGLVWPPVWRIQVVVLDRLRCQLHLLTFATGEHQADCSETPHRDGGGFGDGGRQRSRMAAPMDSTEEARLTQCSEIEEGDIEESQLCFSD